MGGVGTPSLCSQPHGNHWSMVSRRELKGQDSATDLLWVSHVACLSSPFFLLCSNSKLAASWGYETFGRGWRKAAGGMESFILQCPCCVYRVTFIKQYQPKYLPGRAAVKIFSAQSQGLFLLLLSAASRCCLASPFPTAVF